MSSEYQIDNPCGQANVVTAYCERMYSNTGNDTCTVVFTLDDFTSIPGVPSVIEPLVEFLGKLTQVSMPTARRKDCDVDICTFFEEIAMIKKDHQYTIELRATKTAQELLKQEKKS